MFIYQYILYVWGIVLYRTVPHSSLIHEVVTAKPLLFDVQRFAIQASRVSRFRLKRNASWDMLGQKVSTTSTRTQESNKQNKEFTEENYGWVSRKPEKYEKLQGSSA